MPQVTNLWPCGSPWQRNKWCSSRSHHICEGFWLFPLLKFGALRTMCCDSWPMHHAKVSCHNCFKAWQNHCRKNVCVFVCACTHMCMVACVGSNVIISSHNFIVVLFLSLKNTFMFCINLSSSNNLVSVGDAKCRVFDALILSWKGKKIFWFFCFQ